MTTLETGGPGMTTASTMFVHETGTPGAPAVVFLHGAGASGRMWRDHMARLGDRFHCLAPDLPGFGQSNHLAPLTVDETADLIAELIDTRVPGRQAHVAGLSWGGAVTHRLLQRRPELVDRAIIDCAGVFTWRGGPLVLLAITAVSPFLHTRPVVAMFSRMIGMDEAGEADLRKASRRAFRRAFVEGFKGGVSPIEMEVPCPTLLTAGETETLIRPSNAAQATLMPNAVARYAPGVGHGWIARRTELHVRMVEAWLTGLELPAELPPEKAWPGAVERMRHQLEKEVRRGNHRLAARSR
jgi:pimeloyl-ACP methyl ester carboxylesterase